MANPDETASRATDARPKPPRPWRRRFRKALSIFVALFAAFCLFVVVDGWRAFGKAPEGARADRMTTSPHWHDGKFVNPEPLFNDKWGGFRSMFSRSEAVDPREPIPTVEPTLPSKAPSHVVVTWLGHSTTLIAIEGTYVLTDPVWGERTSPVNWAGPGRYYPPPLPFKDLPKIDVVLISHDHYDHLDEPTISKMSSWDSQFIVPLGVGAHLVYWGIDESRITEMAWWDETKVGDLTVACTPARHASGRHLMDQNRTLWASYALIGAHKRVFFSGDTGLFPAMKTIGETYGPFDLTMIEIGAYNAAWPDWHIGPEQAVLAHLWLRGRVMLPIHWGLFSLAGHGWTEPIERVLVAAKTGQVTVASPRPGGSVDPDNLKPQDRWWPNRPWLSDAQTPIVSTLVNHNQ